MCVCVYMCVGAYVCVGICVCLGTNVRVVNDEKTQNACTKHAAKGVCIFVYNRHLCR